MKQKYKKSSYFSKPSKTCFATAKHTLNNSFDMSNKKCLRIYKNNTLYLVENDVSKQMSFWQQFFIRSFDKGNLYQTKVPY